MIDNLDALKQALYKDFSTAHSRVQTADNYNARTAYMRAEADIATAILKIEAQQQAATLPALRKSS